MPARLHRRSLSKPSSKGNIRRFRRFHTLCHLQLRVFKIRNPESQIPLVRGQSAKFAKSPSQRSHTHPDTLLISYYCCARETEIFVRCCLSFHFFVHFEPLPGKEAEFRSELLRVVQPTQAEPGCLAIPVFESMREPVTFAIHSEWVDEAAFERHSQLPHTVRFLDAAEKLLSHAAQGLRSREIAGGVVR